MKSFKCKSPRRDVLKPSQVSRLLDAAKTAGRNGPQLSNYLRLPAFTGAREQDALRLPWTAVDFEGETITVVISKKGETREVEFNGELRKPLGKRAAKRVPDCSFMFPSPRRGGKNKHIASFRVAFNVARMKAGLPEAGFHDLRHYFASMAAMSGIGLEVGQSERVVHHLPPSVLAGPDPDGVVAGQWSRGALDLNEKHASSRRDEEVRLIHQTVPGDELEVRPSHVLGSRRKRLRVQLQTKRRMIPSEATLMNPQSSTPWSSGRQPT